MLYTQSKNALSVLELHYVFAKGNDWSINVWR